MLSFLLLPQICLEASGLEERTERWLSLGILLNGILRAPVSSFERSKGGGSNNFPHFLRRAQIFVGYSLVEANREITHKRLRH